MQRRGCWYLTHDVAGRYWWGGGAVRDRLTGQCLRKQPSRFRGDCFPSRGLKMPTAAEGSCKEGEERKGGDVGGSHQLSFLEIELGTIFL